MMTKEEVDNNVVYPQPDEPVVYPEPAETSLVHGVIYSASGQFLTRCAYNASGSGLWLNLFSCVASDINVTDQLFKCTSIPM